MYSRIADRLGTKTSKKRWKVKKPHMFTSTTLTKAVLEYFTSEGNSGEINPFFQLHDKVHNETAELEPKDSNRHLPPAQLLSELSKSLDPIVRSMIINISYTPITRICFRLLQAIREDIRLELNDKNAYPRRSKEDDSWDFGLANMVLDILGANDAAQRMVPKSRGFACVQELWIAKETFERVWRELRYAEVPESDVRLLDLGYEDADRGRGSD